MSARILIVEDEPEIVEILVSYLKQDGFLASSTASGEEALAKLKNESFDLVLLDIMLPDLNGLEVCREIRKTSSIPVVMLTARDNEADKIVGLELGADDYITKPFSPREVVARVKAVLRRTQTALSEKIIQVGDLSIDPLRYEVKVKGQQVELTSTEFRILEVLARNQGQVFTRLQLIDQVQGYSFEGYERTVDAHIKNIRHKIESDPKQPRYIKTVYGVGYKLVAESG
jgi:DNA-binding response OmpR family regulator